ncbi:MAG: hypothetical protein K8R41_01670, partial [Bacteroidales bacterium]|nr:hypothetical protein [Bacteroidales bacterium]
KVPASQIKQIRIIFLILKFFLIFFDLYIIMMNKRGKGCVKGGKNFRFGILDFRFRKNKLIAGRNYWNADYAYGR